MLLKDKIERLKRAKVSKEKKWLYNLIAWVLKNRNCPYQSLQARINTSFYYNKGFYNEYNIKNKNSKKKQMRDNYQKRKKQIRWYNKVRSKKYNICQKLYHGKMLSKKSSFYLEKEIEKIREKYTFQENKSKKWKNNMNNSIGSYILRTYESGVLSRTSERLINKHCKSIEEKYGDKNGNL